MDIFELLIGKKIRVMTDMKVEVELEISEVKENNHSREIGPSNRENDWYPEMTYWTTYTVKFTNGASKEYNSIKDIKVI